VPNVTHLQYSCMCCTQHNVPWLPAGDVIGCCLDLDAGEMSFYRNGVSMGVAYSGIRKLQVRARVCHVPCSYSE